MPIGCASRLTWAFRGSRAAGTITVLFAALVYANEPNRPIGKVQPKLDLKALSEPLRDLTPEEGRTVDKAISLIQQMHDGEALTYLTSLTQSNSRNSALRVLRAYVLLELGNIAGALDDSKVAESSGGRTAYKCWFLAQVAYLAGNKPLCRREIKHIGNNASYGSDANKLGSVLDGGSR